MKLAAVALILAVSSCTGGHPALAHQVYPGCAPVTVSATAKTWYVDPVNGKTPAAGGLGTQAAPWNSLQGVIAGQWGAAITWPGYTRPLLSSVPYNHPTPAGRIDAPDALGAPPVNPGDTILLMSGSYGDVTVGNYETPTLNTDWVTVEAAPGQTPVFTTLSIGNTTKWLFVGVKVQSALGTNGNTKALVTVSDGGASWPTSNIVLENLDVSSVDDTTGATQAQWVKQGRTGLVLSGSAGDGTNGEPTETCISVTGSHIHNVRTASTLYANSSLFSRNEIDHFGDDGLDFGANNIAITNNFVHDNFDVGDGNHEDAMQGQIGNKLSTVAYNAYSNIVIDGNVVIRQLDPNLAFPTYLQGIDAFDSDWTNMTVTNNVVVTSACWGIDFASVHKGLFAGNSVADDLQVSTPGCTAFLAVAGATHEGLPSSNVRITNNLAEHFYMGSPGDTGMTWDHNAATNSYQAFSGWNFTKNVMSYGEPVGTDATGNISPAKAMDLTTVFQTWDPAHHNYDMRLKLGAAAGATAPTSTGAHSYPN